MLIENVELLKTWLANALEPLCEADPATLAKYVFALVKKDKPEEEVKKQCLQELKVFLNNETEGFVEQLFFALRNRSYMAVALPSGGASGPAVGMKLEPVSADHVTDHRLMDSQQGIKIPNEYNRAPRDQRPAGGYKSRVHPRSGSRDRKSGGTPYDHRSKSPRGRPDDHGSSTDRYHRSPGRFSSNTTVTAQKLVSLATHRGLVRQHSAESSQSGANPSTSRREERRVPALHGSGTEGQSGEGFRSSGVSMADSRMYQSTERLGPPGRYTSRNISPGSRDYERSSHRHDRDQSQYEPQHQEGHSRSRYPDERYSPTVYQRRHRRQSRSRTRSRTRSRSPTRSSTGRASTRYSPGARSRCSSISYRHRSRTPPVVHHQGGKVERGRGGRKNGSMSGEESVSPVRSHSSDSTSTSLSSEMPSTKENRQLKNKKKLDTSAEDEDLLYGESLRTRSKHRTVAQPVQQKVKCQDYEERGYCMRGPQCPYDHGTDLVEFSESALTSVMDIPGLMSTQYGPPSIQAGSVIGQLPLLGGLLPNLSQPPPPLGCQSATMLPPPHFIANPPPPLTGQVPGVSQGASGMIQHHVNPSNLMAPPYKPGEGRALSPQQLPPYQPSVSQSYAPPTVQQAPPPVGTNNSDIYVPQPLTAVSASSVPEPYNPQPYIPRPVATGLSSLSGAVASKSVGSLSEDVGRGQAEYSFDSAGSAELGVHSSSSSSLLPPSSLQRASTYEPTPSGTSSLAGETSTRLIRAGVKRSVTDSFIESANGGSNYSNMGTKKFAADRAMLHQSGAGHPGVRHWIGGGGGSGGGVGAGLSGGSAKDHQANTTLEIRRIPKELNTIARVNEHFLRFGIIINLQVGFENDAESALVSFASHAQALAAYRCSEPMFNNRFIKIFWHNADRQQAEQELQQQQQQQTSQQQDDSQIPPSFSKESTPKYSFPAAHLLKLNNTVKFSGIAMSETSGNVEVMSCISDVPLASSSQEVELPEYQDQQAATVTTTDVSGTVPATAPGSAASFTAGTAAPDGTGSADQPKPAVANFSQTRLVRKPNPREQMRKEAMNRRLELQKQSRALLAKQLAEQKKMIEKLEKTKNKEDRAVIIKALQVMSVSLEKIKAAATAAVGAGAPPKPVPIPLPSRSQLSKVNVRRSSGGSSELSPGLAKAASKQGLLAAAAAAAATPQGLSAATAAAVIHKLAAPVAPAAAAAGMQKQNIPAAKSLTAGKQLQTSKPSVGARVERSSSGAMEKSGSGAVPSPLTAGQSELDKELQKIGLVVGFAGFDTRLENFDEPVPVENSDSGSSVAEVAVEAAVEAAAPAVKTATPAAVAARLAMDEQKEKLRVASLKLETLKREMQTDTSRGGMYRGGGRGGRGRGRGSRGYSVAGAKGPMWTRDSRSMSFDRRPRQLLVSGFSCEEQDDLLQHLSTYGDIEAHAEVDPQLPSISVLFTVRAAAEKVLREGCHFNNKTLQMTWLPSAAAATSSTPANRTLDRSSSYSSSSGQDRLSENEAAISRQLMDDLALESLIDDYRDAGSRRSERDHQEWESRLSISTTDVSVDLMPEDDILLEEEDDEEEDESRSWRR